MRKTSKNPYKREVLTKIWVQKGNVHDSHYRILICLPLNLKKFQGFLHDYVAHSKISIDGKVSMISLDTLIPRIQVHALIYVAEAKVHAIK